jgi:hypothetical protein
MFSECRCAIIFSFLQWETAAFYTFEAEVDGQPVPFGEPEPPITKLTLGIVRLGSSKGVSRVKWSTFNKDAIAGKNYVQVACALLVFYCCYCLLLLLVLPPSYFENYIPSFFWTSTNRNNTSVVACRALLSHLITTGGPSMGGVRRRSESRGRDRRDQVLSDL